MPISTVHVSVSVSVWECERERERADDQRSASQLKFHQWDFGSCLCALSCYLHICKADRTTLAKQRCCSLEQGTVHAHRKRCCSLEQGTVHKHRKPLNPDGVWVIAAAFNLFYGDIRSKRCLCPSLFQHPRSQGCNSKRVWCAVWSGQGRHCLQWILATLKVTRIMLLSERMQSSDIWLPTSTNDSYETPPYTMEKGWNWERLNRKTTQDLELTQEWPLE